ncbi:NADP-specific glutamate dehydrogenase, partial [Cribrihabitans sp. XS_ASV171]
LTGKGRSFGGSAVRVEATGWGLVYFTEAMLAERGEEIAGKRVAISGKGNVATHAAEKAIACGARVITLSDTAGTLVAPDGLTLDDVAWVRACKQAGADITDPPGTCNASFHEGTTPWEQEVEIALPCATQNEMDGEMAQALVDGGARMLAEGANMPLTDEALETVARGGITRAPGKASNAGGVAVSGLEMSQNSRRRFA